MVFISGLDQGDLLVCQQIVSGEVILVISNYTSVLLPVLYEDEFRCVSLHKH